MLAAVALVDRPALERRTAPVAAGRAGPTLAPAQLKQHGPAGRLSAEARPKLGFAQPLHPPPQTDFRAHTIAPHHPKPAQTLAHRRLFVMDNQEKEFHSSLGNILMSYGVVGLGLLFAFFFVVFRSSPRINLFYFGLIMLYGVTHMGMRDTMLWIFLGLVYVQGMAEELVAERDRHASALTSGCRPRRSRSARISSV